MLMLRIIALSACCIFLIIPGFGQSSHGYQGIPVFLGYTQQEAGTLATVRNLSEFYQTFGQHPGFIQSGSQAAVLPDFLLEYSLQLFWANGGGEVHVLSTGRYTSEGQAPKAPHFTQALSKLGAKKAPNLIIMPELIHLTGPDYNSVCQAALLHAEKFGRFILLDIQDTGTSTTSFANFRNVIGNQQLSYGAAYWPYVQSSFELPSGTKVIIPSSAAVAGRIVQNDQQKGVWKAPAGISISSVIQPVHPLSQNEISSMTTHSSGISINPIKAFPGRGILIWGARTLAGNDNEWRYVPTRRFATFLENQVRILTSFARRRQNNPATWQEIKKVVHEHLSGLFRQGAFAGEKTSDAYFVKIGLGETMTARDISQGRMIIELGFAPLKPAEFIVLRIAL